jgi:glycosyltransferase involved in cell wall biosynthesis
MTDVCNHDHPMRKGIYLLPENDCLKPASGPNRHYLEGLKELGRYFEITPVHIFEDAPVTDIKGLAKPAEPSAFRKRLQRMGLFGTARDIKFFLKNHYKFFGYLRRVRKQKPEFIYERASYLNYNGILIAKWLGIPHFYEVNGLNAEQMRGFYRSWLIEPLKWIQKWTYNASDLNFCVGDLGKLLGIRAGKHVAVQNGIEKEFTDEYRDVNKKVGDTVHMVWVGKAMDHHRLDILVDALNRVKNPGRVEIHLIGERIAEYINPSSCPGIRIKDHGAVPHEALPGMLHDMHVGLLPYTFEYGSNLKLFLYGAAKLAVVAPAVENIKGIFTEEEIIYFEQLNGQDMAEKLDRLLEDADSIQSYAGALYRKVSSSYTWEAIFRDMAKTMESLIVEKAGATR